MIARIVGAALLVSRLLAPQATRSKRIQRAVRLAVKVMP